MELKLADCDDRLNFVRKVYVILLTQLAITAGFTAIAITNLDMCIWMQENWWLVIVVTIFIIIIEIALVCAKHLAR